jgi:GT2 family glycosyltransferase
MQGIIASDLITVLIVNWNGGDLLSACINALKAQTILPKKVFIIDNDSHDNSLESLDNWDRLEIIRANKNLGFAAANNLAIEKVGTKYFATLNPDAFPEPDWIDNLALAIKSHPDAASFACRQMSADNENVIDGLGDVYHFSGLAWRRGYGRPIVNSDYEPCSVFSACGGAGLYQTEIIKKVGGFDEDFFCYMEDVDLGFRLRLFGHECIYVPNAVVKHIGSASTGKNSDFTVYYGHRNLLATYIKNMPSALFWIFILPHIGMHFIALVYYSLKGRHKIIFKAKNDGLRTLRLNLEKRKTIQPLRKASLFGLMKVISFTLLPLRK